MGLCGYGKKHCNDCGRDYDWQTLDDPCPFCAGSGRRREAANAAPIDRGALSLLLHALDGEHARAVLREALCPTRFPDDMWTAPPVVLLACVVRVMTLDPKTTYRGARAARIREAVEALAVRFEPVTGQRVR